LFLNSNPLSPALIKVQKVERPTNRSYYVNLPVVLAEAIDLQKGEPWEWSMEDKNTLVLSRVKKREICRRSRKA
jgi:antitoxin component of MazEF toxin-antitoxin module